MASRSRSIQLSTRSFRSVSENSAGETSFLASLFPHRVDFATIEQRPVTGYRDALETVMGIILFFAEYTLVAAVARPTFSSGVVRAAPLATRANPRLLAERLSVPVWNSVRR
jgi:hypothetical protein